jgi:hypothetical protein
MLKPILTGSYDCAEAEAVKPTQAATVKAAPATQAQA